MTGVQTCALPISFTDLTTYRLPAAGIVSILHRISGALMFLLMPFIIWMFDKSVSSEVSYAKFRAAFAKAQQDEDVKAAREKLLEKRKSMEFATAAEKKDARADFETLSEGVRKALRAAIAKADGSLSKEVIEKATDALEDKLKEKAKEAAASKKGAETKGAAKPGEKKPEAPAIGK